MIPGPGEKGNETWKGDSWRFGGGAPRLTSFYAPALNLVYWGTGNAAADFYDAERVPTGADKKKDKLYTVSVVALDADTGSSAGTIRKSMMTSGIGICLRSPSDGPLDPWPYVAGAGPYE